MTTTMTESNGEETWTRRRIKILISTRLQFEQHFQAGGRRQNSIWKDILKEIKTIDAAFPHTLEEIKKKYTNLFTTYKRIKKRNSLSGRSRTIWEFYEEFDAVYGSRHFVEAPRDNLVDSLEEEDSPNTGNLTNPSVETSSRKRKQNNVQDILDYLKESDNEEKIRHKEFMDLERDKLQVEKDKIAVMNDLKSLMDDLRG